MKNSWDTDWGPEQGHGWIGYESNRIGRHTVWARSLSTHYAIPNYNLIKQRVLLNQPIPEDLLPAINLRDGGPSATQKHVKPFDTEEPASGDAVSPGAGASPPKLAARTPSDSNQLNGAWLLADHDGTLTIEGSEWRHPEKGLAMLSRGSEAGDYEVTYQQPQGIKCQYRVTKAADGNVLILEAADATQSLDYCPSGKLLRAE